MKMLAVLTVEGHEHPKFDTRFKFNSISFSIKTIQLSFVCT